MSKQLVVLIAGVTNGGKTTICNNLKNKFDNISILHQDDFYYNDYENHLERIPEINFFLWDKINAFDMDKLITSIKSQTSNILVLEGILLLDDKRIVELADLKFFITMDKDSCFERRRIRNYVPPDPPKYFDNYVWPEYEKHLSIIKKKKYDVIFLSGTDSIDHNTTIVVNSIKQKLLK